jgi:glycerol-3-phosphate acyltransferase PlsX
MTGVMTEEIRKSWVATFGALLARRSLRRVRERMDDSHYGGAVLLGLSHIVVVAHGRSNSTAIRHAIRVAKQSIEYDILSKIQAGIEEGVVPREAELSTAPPM